MTSRWIPLGALLAAIAIGFGAFGAHALRGRLLSSGPITPDSQRLLEVFETAVRYQMYHSLALVLLGLIAGRQPTACTTAAGWLFTGGIVLFSGSLYALVLSGIKALGAITPFGGAAFIAGWICLAVAAVLKSE